MERTPFAVAAIAAMALSAAPAAGQVPADTSYGGGEIVNQPPGRSFPGRAGDANVSVRTSADGTAATAGGTLVVPCRGRGTTRAVGVGTQPVGVDGSFTINEKRNLGRGVTTDVTITGRIEGNKVTGEAVAAVADRGRQVCSGRVPYVSYAVPPLGPAPAPPPAGGVLRGLVTGEASAPYDIAMRLAADGRSVLRVNFSAPVRCRSGRGDEVYYEPGGTIRRDGSFRIVNRWFLTFSDAVERGVTRIEGRFVNGGVVGTVSVTTTARSRKGRKRVVDRCSTGKRAFRAMV